MEHDVLLSVQVVAMKHILDLMLFKGINVSHYNCLIDNETMKPAGHVATSFIPK